MSSLEILKHEIDCLDENIEHWRSNGADESSNLIKHRLSQKKALVDAVKALEKVGQVRDEVAQLKSVLIQEAAFIARNCSDFETEEHETWIRCALRLRGASEKAGAFIDSLDKVQS